MNLIHYASNPDPISTADPIKDSYAIFPDHKKWVLCFHPDGGRARLWRITSSLADGLSWVDDLQQHFSGGAWDVDDAFCNDLLAAVAMAERYEATGTFPVSDSEGEE